MGGTWDMPWYDIELQFDYLHTRMNHSAYYVDLSQEIVGTTAAGSPIYDFVNGTDNFMLTNSSESANSDILSFVLKKEFDMGLNLLFGYAYTQAEDVAPMTSAVALSNYENLATLDINNPAPLRPTTLCPIALRWSPIGAAACLGMRKRVSHCAAT